MITARILRQGPPITRLRLALAIMTLVILAGTVGQFHPGEAVAQDPGPRLVDRIVAIVDEDIVRVAPTFMEEFALSLDRPDADAIFISCGALRVLDIIEDLEQRVGKPVVTSNQALVWDVLRLAGIEDRFEGYGRLFRDH